MICPCCQRISRAEESARKRAIKKANPISPLEELKKKFGSVSITLLRMKLKLSYEDAKKLYDEDLMHDSRRNKDVHPDTEVL